MQSMPGLKILVVARRFWPFTDDGCQRLLHLCAALTMAGAKVTVLTARWHASWPPYSICREVTVHRLLPAPNTNWNESHFQKNVVQWMTKKAAGFDCIYVDRPDGLLLALQGKSAKWNLPVFARFSPDESGFGLSSGQKLTQAAMADACRRCFRVVCATPNAHRILVSQGIRESQIVRIGDIAWDPVVRNDELRTLASNALFDMSSDFLIPGRTDLFLHLGVSEAIPLRMAIQVVCDLLDAGVSIRMWVIGAGLDPSALYDLIKLRGWHREILLFDGFDDLQELIRVADCCIASNPKEAIQFTLPMLATAGVPMIIADQPDCRGWLPEANHFQLYASEQVLAEKIQDFVAHRERWTSLASSLRQGLRRSKSVDDCIQQWLSLFRDSFLERKA